MMLSRVCANPARPDGESHVPWSSGPRWLSVPAAAASLGPSTRVPKMPTIPHMSARLSAVRAALRHRVLIELPQPVGQHREGVAVCDTGGRGRAHLLAELTV